MVKITSKRPDPMLQWFFVSVKYQIWPLPKDAAQLRTLAIDLQVPGAHSWMHSRFDTSLVQSSILKTLKAFRKDASYVLFLLLPIFAIAAILIGFFAWGSEILLSCTSISSIFCHS